ncbi:MAG TPA: DegT/DnrJ/EryC1/StrS family aminotransferase [Candidatus Hydrogenedentes bacterium]|nr:DegT/DnrJ/EryC1/StrS family aminotransferase [Candidatus Hydrogenedentota bacterium]HRZ83409.1 DegT/DnrJ/EryC1/StrS family aminotransferase [Candidatus Hydrogenedentota bacterium]
MRVPLLDLKAQYAEIRGEVEAAVLEVMESQLFRGGPQVEGFEREMAGYTGCAHAAGVASGTDALYLLFRALELKPGDEVITTPFTFFATAGAIVNAGGVPVFADVRPDTLTLDPAAVEERITPRTRAIVPVHLFGHCADMDAFLDLGGRHGIPVIEDAAQALGASHNGRMAGSMGRAAAVSFYPTKNLGAAGEGGMVLTSDPALDEKVRLLRCHGARAAYLHDMVGVNSHLPALQAAVLRVKLRHLDRWNDLRRRHALRYAEALGGAEGVSLPVELPGYRHIYHQYVVRIPRRDEAKALFQAEGVGCGVFYPVPLHRQACFAAYSGDASCPVADKACGEVLALPVYPELTDGQIDTVAGLLRRHVGVSD